MSDLCLTDQETDDLIQALRSAQSDAVPEQHIRLEALIHKLKVLPIVGDDVVRNWVQGTIIAIDGDMARIKWKSGGESVVSRGALRKKL